MVLSLVFLPLGFSEATNTSNNESSLPENTTTICLDGDQSKDCCYSMTYNSGYWKWNSDIGIMSCCGDDYLLDNWCSTEGRCEKGDYIEERCRLGKTCVKGFCVPTSTSNLETPPMIIANDLTFYENQTFSLPIDVVDETSTVPPDILISGWINSSVHTAGFSDAGRHYVTIKACNTYGCSEKEISITIVDVNQPPVIKPFAKRQAYVNETLRFRIEAYDPDYLIETGSAGGTSGDKGLIFITDSPYFNISDTGVIEWTPTDEQVGEHVFNLDVSDDKSITKKRFEISVLKNNIQPDYSSTDLQLKSITLLYPTEMTVIKTEELNLVYSAHEPPAFLLYEVDGEKFQADSAEKEGSLIINNLKDGMHNVTLYALDSSMNIVGFSDTVSFMVDTHKKRSDLLKSMLALDQTEIRIDDLRSTIELGPGGHNYQVEIRLKDTSETLWRSGKRTISLYRKEPEPKKELPIVSVNIPESGSSIIKEKQVELKEISMDKVREILSQDETREKMIEKDSLKSSWISNRINITEKNTDVRKKARIIGVMDNDTHLTRNITEVTIQIRPKNTIYNLSIYEEIPKSVAADITELDFDIEPEVLNPDPLIVWHFAKIDKPIDLNYRVDEEVEIETLENINTVIIADEVRESRLKSYLPLLIIPFIIVLVVVFARFGPKQKANAMEIYHSLIKRHNVHKPNSRIDTLENFIIAAYTKNWSPATIRHTLINHGWDPVLVDKKIKELIAK
ncbi:hypothetical protein JXB31_01065 [Candidatus Woesearchaeota archaeon]|nr:hypothetical protein [Candidatus Woesearchaeota archaeon]